MQNVSCPDPVSVVAPTVDFCQRIDSLMSCGAFTAQLVVDRFRLEANMRASHRALLHSARFIAQAKQSAAAVGIKWSS